MFAPPKAARNAGVVILPCALPCTLLKMLADKIGVTETKKWVNEQAGTAITFKEYPRNNEFIDNLHDRTLDKLLEK